ncbi:hypothetical protein LCGC14_3150640 [marine sediment metagenome]|uniref:Uncharacterized protein n=1 Tax=marine sediment metagenome TaxID=412755 RepID=A0A0F8WIA5_9ZZZZ
MTGRAVPFDVSFICGICGNRGAYNFIVANLCPECVWKIISEIQADEWEFSCTSTGLIEVKK